MKKDTSQMVEVLNSKDFHSKSQDVKHLNLLLNRYNEAPEIFKAGRYWEAYERKIVDELYKVDLTQMRSGRYPLFATFGFNESVYHYRHDAPFVRTLYQKFVRKFIIRNSKILPYNLRLIDIREMAFRHAEILGALNRARPISEIETSMFGNPQDLFKMNGKHYTMRYLTFYIRYCCAHQYINLKGDEIIVELGSGSGHQVEILKKLYPNITILCFDLPGQLFLCEQYLKKALTPGQVVSSTETIDFTDLKMLEKGKVYMFGNWLFPILKNFNFDVFWNAASFGEMEPEIVKNYVDIIQGNCKWIYLLQAEKGKESTATSGVKTPIDFNFYSKLLERYDLKGKEIAYEAHRRVAQSGGYFQGVWSMKS